MVKSILTNIVSLSNFYQLIRVTRPFYSLTRMSSESKSKSRSDSSSSEESSTLGHPELHHSIIAMMAAGISPKDMLNFLAPSFRAPPDANDMTLWSLLLAVIKPPARKKLTQYNTIEDAIQLVKNSKKIVVLSGAGISTSAGLPDFRSRDGIYVQIHAQHPDLQDPGAMFDINYFRKNPLPFYQFAKALYPGQYKPTIGHKFIKCIEDHDKLLRNYSQNIDTLEKQAGIKRVIECHGSFAKATCTNCKYEVDCDLIRDDIMGQKVPLCSQCHKPENDAPEDGLGVMKPNIVFFGEQLGADFHNSLDYDKNLADLLIVIGSSLKVRPVALIPNSIPSNIPQILINKEPLEHMTFDIELLGNSDDIIQELCLRLGDKWTQICEPNTQLKQELTRLPEIKEEIADEIGETKEIKNDFPPKQSSSDKDDKFSAGAEEDHGSISMSCDEQNSFRSNMANIASDDSEQNVVDETDDLKDKNSPGKSNEDQENSEDCVAPESNQNSDDDWWDLGEIESESSGAIRGNLKANIAIPESSYFYLKPNRYMFRGAELTKAQLESYTKESPPAVAESSR